MGRISKLLELLANLGHYALLAFCGIYVLILSSVGVIVLFSGLLNFYGN